MRSWPSPTLPVLPERGELPQIEDTSTSRRVQPVGGGVASLYVCGITPYDSTHLGHASTYIAFDTLIRAWRDAGIDVTFTQNVTDVDDPLLERAQQTGVNWAELAGDQTELFASDMQALRVIAPDHFIGIAESTDLIAASVAELVQAGLAYPVDTPDAQFEGASDIYADLSKDAHLGDIGHLDEATMDEFFAERGGDPDRPGKKHRRDALLWRVARTGEPRFDGGTLGLGRPGWHIECASIAQKYSGVPFTVQGGGTDLIYPHHEMSISHLRGLTGNSNPAGAYLHTGLVAFEGHKMSKSRGNLVFVSELLQSGVPAAAIRLCVLDNHYSDNWEYTPASLDAAKQRLVSWQQAAADGGASVSQEGLGGTEVLRAVRSAIADDLNTAAALAVVDDWAKNPGPDSGPTVTAVVDALLGIDLRPEPSEPAN